MKIVNVILSGGVGSRLWPLSRKSRPKQYLPIFEDQSLFEKTVIRNSKVCNQVMVVGGVDNYQLSRDILNKEESANYLELVEAAPRNTAAAIAFAALSLPEDAIMLVTPSDHLIGDQEVYDASINQAIEMAKKGFLVTFGLIPSKPETGFGYIEHEGNDVLGFREKPGLAQAQSYLDQGNFLWNSGMFCFEAGTYLSELKKHEPEVYKTSKIALENAKDGFLPLDLSMKIPSISVDYAVMEKSDKIKVVPSSFSWSDMGSFEALFDYYPEGSKEKIDGNLVLGSGKHVEFVGLEDVVLVETKDAILVLNRSNAQDVKKVYERLEKENPGLLS
ncbi:sugar phosphate nucleotidyltransferase [Cyclobacterium sp. 1_MG-2023]|uniref:mannose-1-phosphate guanylyltransferase n=1 Tax=Cyclobacterium sp. 1_MG-2023 TaxID=3062681 RepID=UPI0026E3CDC1|nr:sugar phosphate nucleotidyltransferase [Cyclobacterium sp. 1_MG-2023]MDO6436245.1 sugar phosphate nucleotidyltransferase [Cyclobacterium sp. 1_MG-2023]